VRHGLVARQHAARDRLVLGGQLAMRFSIAARSSGVKGRLYAKS
jgi:hypothetical protein